MNPMHRIDLNCDLGEGCDNDAELMPLITSSNIACGGHAGDGNTMRATVELALAHGVAIGAHPGFCDHENFGRLELPLPANEVQQLVLSQTRALQTIARECGGVVTHVKPHGALYNMAARDEVIAQAIAKAVYEADPELVLYGLHGSKLIAAGMAVGLRIANEAFADRTYQTDGSLTPRSQPGALIENAETAAEQVRQMVCEHRVTTLIGASVMIAADTICLHGDGAHAVEFAIKLNGVLRELGIRPTRL